MTTMSSRRGGSTGRPTTTWMMWGSSIGRIVASGALVIGWCTGLEVRAGQTPADAEPLVVFYAIGDAPYLFLEVPLLAAQLTALPPDAEFLVHVGDIKWSATPCEESSYRDVANLLRLARCPVLVVPGDNEWNDCRDPDQAWQFWCKYFLHFEQHWKPRFHVARAAERQENFSFELNHVLFVGLNIVGGRVHDPAEWRQRHRESAAWLQNQLAEHRNASHCVVMAHAALGESHRDFIDALRRFAVRFDRPMLYLHGDGHAWKFDQPLDVSNLWRIQVDRAGLTPPVQIRVHSDAKAPFQVNRRLHPPRGAASAAGSGA